MHALKQLKLDRNKNSRWTIRSIKAADRSADNLQCGDEYCVELSWAARRAQRRVDIKNAKGLDCVT